MFIRRTQTGRAASGEQYFSHRLVQAERVGGKVRQVTLLNLGRHFPVPKEQWPAVCMRIEELVSGHQRLIPVGLDAVAEAEAQRIAAHLIAAQGSDSTRNAATPAGPDWQTIDLESLETLRPRTVGIEHVALWAMEQVKLDTLLTDIGLNGLQRAAAKALIIGRMARPGSERATHRWLTRQTALGELIDEDFEVMGLAQLYRTSDRLWAGEHILQQRLFEEIRTLFDLECMVTLYDLTNTYFEGEATANPDAKRGHSKEKRSDCPLVTLGLVLDNSGFARKAKVFPGNAVECRTLQGMLDGLGAPADALVVMDRGVATAENIAWLQESGRRYIVVSREQHRRDVDLDNAETLQTASNQQVFMDRVLDESGEELRLYCYSAVRAAKETAIEDRKAKAFEAQLTALVAGIENDSVAADIESVCHRIGQIKKTHSQAARHYAIAVDWRSDRNRVVAIRWTAEPVDGSRRRHPGVYCLRTNLVDWDAERLWRTYTMLTDLEAVFRSLKTELGLRPIYHQVQRRVSGHLFITVLAYQLVQIIRRHLAEHGIHDSWSTLRDQLVTQQRVTTRFTRKDGKTLHIRHATKAEPAQLRIYSALGIDPSPGGRKKTVA